MDHALKEKKLFMVHNSGNKRKRTVSGYSSNGRILDSCATMTSSASRPETVCHCDGEQHANACAIRLTVAISSFMIGGPSQWLHRNQPLDANQLLFNFSLKDWPQR